jgi:hypothetical protein
LRLPNAARAIIEPAKLRDYLLNDEHPANRGKAVLFVALGYARMDWQHLEQDLRAQHLNQDAVADIESHWGRMWRIEAPLRGPAASARIRSVWIVESGTDVPRFVTAYQVRR